CLALAAVFAANRVALAIDHVTYRVDGQLEQRDGQVVAEKAGALLFMTPDLRLTLVQADEVVEHTVDDEDFEPLDRKALEAELLAELPEGFQVYKRPKHFMIAHNTSQAYARWCAALLERLYSAFVNYWDKQGFEVSEPDTPLVVLVFADRASFNRYARSEIGVAADSVIGYYSLTTNRMCIFDLTGVEAAARNDPRHSISEQRIQQLLSRPESERRVATVVHEATHLLAFNCGLHQRMADIPLWVSEGVAIYFETPDVGSNRGWRTIGGVNRVRLAEFRRYLPRRPADSLETLIADNGRFRNTTDAADAYGEAWALTYYLLERHTDAYHRYLKSLADRQPLDNDTPEKRLAAFREAFGDDIGALDRDMVRYIQQLR
ncbi:MAG: DUF1570 domain-containing protein, partial [Pirellulales bacterium]